MGLDDYSVQPITAAMLAIVDEMASLTSIYEAAIAVLLDTELPRTESIKRLEKRIEEADL